MLDGEEEGLDTTWEGRGGAGILGWRADIGRWKGRG